MSTVFSYIVQKHLSQNFGTFRCYDPSRRQREIQKLIPPLPSKSADPSPDFPAIGAAGIEVGDGQSSTKVLIWITGIRR